MTALSLDELAKGQEEHCRQLALIQRDFPLAIDAILNRLDELSARQSESAEREFQLCHRLLEAYKGTSDLVVAALDQCQTILDADNSILENIERRLRAGGR